MSDRDRPAVAFALDALVDCDLPADPGAAIADALRERGIAVPDDWPDTYRETTTDAPEGAAVPRQARVSMALRRAGVDPTGGDGNAVRRAVVAAVDPAVETKPGAADAVAAAAERGPVGVLADATVPDLARRALIRSAVDREHVDAVVTAGGCGWHPPHPEAFEALAARLDVAGDRLVYVGADPRPGEGDGGDRDHETGVRAVGGTPVVVGADATPTDVPALASLAGLRAWLADL